MEPSTNVNNEIVTVIVKTENSDTASANNNISTNNAVSKTPLDPSVIPTTPTHNIGSKNSAFQPYKAITVLTNLQRGNFKTLHKDVATPLTFHEKAARGDLKNEEVNDVTPFQLADICTHFVGNSIFPANKVLAMLYIRRVIFNIFPGVLTYFKTLAYGEYQLMKPFITVSNVDSEDSEGKTALIWAAYHGRLPTVNMLLEKGANVNYQGLSEETPLMYAASNARSPTHIEIINILIEAGADVDAADYEGQTALIYATRGNFGPAVTALLQRGASFTKVNENGDSAFNIAVARGLPAAQNALENYIREVIEKTLIK